VAAITKTPSNTWKAIIRKRGWIARIALYTGMRAGEIKSLTRRQVNLEKRTVYLSETKNGSPRTVPLTKKAENIFRIALSNPVRPFDTDLIYFGEPGRDKILRPYEFRPAWYRTLKDAGIKRYTHLRAEDLVARLDQVMG
jgi:integrase